MKLPDRWKYIKLSDIGNISKGSGIKREDSNSGTIPAVRYGELYTSHNDYIKEFYSFISEKVAEESVLLKKGDLLFTCSGETKEDIGKCAAFVSDCKAYAGGDLIIFSPKIPCDSKFLGFLCNSYSINKQRYRYAQGDSVVHISTESIANLKITFPPLAEQQKIADILCKQDKIISFKQKLLEQKQKQKKWLMQKLLEAPLTDANDEEKFSLDGVVIDKSGWKKCRLVDIAEGFEYGMNSASKNFDGKNKYIRITDINDESHKFENKDIVSPCGKIEEKYKVKEGDILFARTGASTGKSYLYNIEDGDLYFAGFLIRVHIKDANPYLIFSQTLTSKYSNWLKIMSVRSGQPGINAEEFKNLSVFLPSLPEQKIIAQVLSTADKEIALLKSSIEQEKQKKKSLAQLLLTGTVRVKI